jgi:hypothetical protein
MAATSGSFEVKPDLVSTAISRCSSLTESSVPPYDDGKNGGFELGIMTPTTTASTSSLPKYEDLDVQGGTLSGAAFCATRTLQIEALGHRLFSLPLPPKPLPIAVFEVLPGGVVGSQVYTSIRASRCSGNSVLVRADEASETALCSTTYRFGPCRPPRIKLHAAASLPSPSPSPAPAVPVAPASPEESFAHEEEFEVLGRGCTTRAQTIRTHLGTFVWRYASRAERRALDADNLLVLDKITTVAIDEGGGRIRQEERRRRVAQLVRNDEFRSQNTSRRTAGNGGRLMIDAREWFGEKGAVEQLEAVAVASCLVMLKKEVDRRRAVQAMAIGGAASS